MKITVFTPTFNRGYCLTRLYNSLVMQSNKNFEWLIINDGSTDDTDKLINTWILENKLNIRYKTQENSGKHIAINKGVSLATGELFFIVDSDDYLNLNALETLITHYKEIKNDDTFCGVSGLISYSDGTRTGDEVSFKILDCSTFDFRHTHKIKGDMAEAYKTSILKTHPFPEIINEKFCTEAVVWNRIAKSYKMRYFASKIYVCEYLPDGLSSNYIKTHSQSPKSSMLYYQELKEHNISLFKQYKAVMNYWRFSYSTNDISFIKKLKIINSVFSIIAIPVGFFKYRKDKIKMNQK